MPASQRSNLDSNPVLVELYHGSDVESRHRGMVALANAQGEILWSLGWIEQLTCIRSTLKPMQALALLQTGAFESAQLTNEHLAIACGSHSGEPRHVKLVAEWLDALNLSQANLKCGCSRPLDSEAYRTLIQGGVVPTELHHNCSGKHAGFLTIASHLGADIDSYLEQENPVQQALLSVLEDQLDQTISAFHINIDGCSAPNIFAPFQVFASAFGRFVGNSGGDATAESRQRIIKAMAAYPELVSGIKRFSAALSHASDGKVIGKWGAEGSYLALLPAAGLSILLSIDDGAKRAAHAAILAILSNLGILSAETANELGPKFLSSRGEPIGHFTTSAAFGELNPEFIPMGR